MDLRSLNTFIHVAETKSFTRAAERLGYSQPTISLQIKQLEQEMGVALFDRIGHTVSLTDAGHGALAYAQRICQLSQEMVNGSNLHQEPRGRIRLAMADSLCVPLVLRGFADLRAAHPGISLQVVTAGTGEMFRKLDHNEVDMVCTLDSHIYNSSYVIASEEKIGVHFIAASSNPLAAKKRVTIHDLLPHPFLLTEKGMSYNRLLEEQLARDSLEIQPILEIGSADLICQLVEADLGLSFLPDYVTEEAVQAGRIVRLNVEGLDVELWKQLLYRRDKWMSPPMRAILDHLAEKTL
ncbi:MAG: LysR family transcriptional regulator [Clostridia bacterium]|nr:LysR family transcriptional regulator [Clostridia bacterium]